MGPGWVVLKGGHRRDIESGPAGAGEVVDLVYDGSEHPQSQRTLPPRRPQAGHRMHVFGGHRGLPGQGARGTGSDTHEAREYLSRNLAVFRRVRTRPAVHCTTSTNSGRRPAVDRG